MKLRFHQETKHPSPGFIGNIFLNPQTKANQPAFRPHPKTIARTHHRPNPVVRLINVLPLRIIVKTPQRISVTALQPGISTHPYQPGTVLCNARSVCMRKPLVDCQMAERLIPFHSGRQTQKSWTSFIFCPPLVSLLHCIPK